MSEKLPAKTLSKDVGNAHCTRLESSLMPSCMQCRCYWQDVPNRRCRQNPSDGRGQGTQETKPKAISCARLGQVWSCAHLLGLKAQSCAVARIAEPLMGLELVIQTSSASRSRSFKPEKQPNLVIKSGVRKAGKQIMG